MEHGYASLLLTRHPGVELRFALIDGRLEFVHMHFDNFAIALCNHRLIVKAMLPDDIAGGGDASSLDRKSVLERRRNTSRER
jgi:hypothetical protein